MTKRILITGAHSYIGQHFMRYAQKNKMIVDEISVHKDDWKIVDFSQYDAILHVAAMVHKKEQEGMLPLYRAVNCDLPVEIAKKAKKDGVKHFVFMSTIAIFGLSGQVSGIEVINENSKIDPKTYYGRTKADAEILLNGLADSNFAVTNLRPPMVYGKDAPGNYGSLSRLALRLPILPGIKNSRSMIYVDNLTSFIFEVIQHRVSGSFSPQNKEVVDTNSMIKLIRTTHGKKTIVLPFGTSVVKFGAHFSGLIEKVYGSLVVTSSTVPVDNYQVINFIDSIKITEN